MTTRQIISDAELSLMVRTEYNYLRYTEGKPTFTAIFMDDGPRIYGEFVTFGADTRREALAAAREYGIRFLDGARVVGWLDEDE